MSILWAAITVLFQIALVVGQLVFVGYLLVRGFWLLHGAIEDMMLHFRLRDMERATEERIRRSELAYRESVYVDEDTDDKHGTVFKPTVRGSHE